MTNVAGLEFDFDAYVTMKTDVLVELNPRRRKKKK